MMLWGFEIATVVEQADTHSSEGCGIVARTGSSPVSSTKYILS